MSLSARLRAAIALALLLGIAPAAMAQETAEHAADPHAVATHAGGEASLVLPDLSSVQFLSPALGLALLGGGFLVGCLAGLVASRRV